MSDDGRLPPQTRAEWVAEFNQLFVEAKKRGDKRPPLKLLGQWMKFRKGGSSANSREG
jgi:hypothetical protein